MKKIVLFLAVVLLFAVNAKAEDTAANTVSAANEVKARANAAATQEVVVLDETANDENWNYHKMLVIDSLQDIDKKIEEAKKNKKPVAELEAQKNKLIEQLDGFDNKIMEEGKDEEMIKARAEAEKTKAEDKK